MPRRMVTSASPRRTVAWWYTFAAALGGRPGEAAEGEGGKGGGGGVGVGGGGGGISTHKLHGRRASGDHPRPKA
jgi:hypothetical protein